MNVSLMICHIRNEIVFALVSGIELLFLLPLNLCLATFWFYGSLILFFFWATLGISPTTKGDHNCIDVGFRYKFHELKEDLSKTKFEIVSVVFLVRPATFLIEEFILPTVETPFTFDPFLLLVYGPLLEEFYFRGILQERLGWVIPEKYAILLSSGVFSFYHWVPGNPLDIILLTRFIRSLFYGVVYSKTRNILASYVSHLGVNLWGFLPI
jgi:membrane protease YdiL (CAAX protease family)